MCDPACLAKDFLARHEDIEEYVTAVLRRCDTAGSAIIFAGLACLWCARNIENSAMVHYCVMVFFALIAVIHIVAYLNGNLPITSILVNSLPIAGLLVPEGLYRSQSSTRLLQ